MTQQKKPARLDISSDEKPQKKFVQPFYDDEDENDIDHTLKEELAERGLEYRFVDYKQAAKNGGSSRSGWRVYVRESKDPRIAGISGMTDPDGLTRKGTLVLAVKTQKAAERQRQRVKDQNRTQKRYTELKAAELDSDARQLGGNSQVIVGYEKNS